jgi:hypothetical protein
MTSSNDLIATVARSTTLRAHVVDERGAPRLHGYDVHGDLALNYSFAEVVLTVLRGEAPTAEEGHAFAVALTFLAPVGAGDGPVHTASLCAMLDAPHGSVIGAAAVALVDQAEAMIERAPTGASDEDRGGVAALRNALGSAVTLVPALAREDLRLDAALVAVLRACGLQRPAQLACAITMARLPAALAEAERYTPADFRDYPIDVPHYRYEEDRHG